MIYACRCRAIAALVLGFLVCAGAAAQAPPDTEPPPADAPVPVNWALASVLGTGWYDIDAGRNAFIVHVPYRQVLRSSKPGPPGQRETGVFINWHGSLGLLDVNIDPGIINPGNFGTASFTPGVELEIPLAPRWYLRPYANFGWGTTLGDGPSAWVYYAGVKSRYWLDEARRWALHNGVGFAGFDPDDGPSGGLSTAYAGIEYGQHLQRKSGEPLTLWWTVGYRAISDSADFGLRGTEGLQEIDDTVGLGLAVGRPDRPYRWWILSFDRLGLTYNFEPGGGFGAVTLNLRSWFDQ